jgi:hypothetical protein
MTNNIRGLGNFHLRELSPRAFEALNRLNVAGWMNGRSATCSCGRAFSMFTKIICHECVPRCPHRALSGYVIKRDGVAVARNRCGYCGIAMSDPRRGSWIYDVCFKDHREDQEPRPCERCGSPDGTQLHHWAPYAIFADADAWPKSWLCQPCHSTWHGAMRRADGYRLADDDLASSPNTSADDTVWCYEGREVGVIS